MLEAYKVGIDIAMTSNVTPALEKIAKQMADLDKVIKTTRDGIKGIAADLAELGRAGASVSRLASNMEKLGKSGSAGIAGGMSDLVTATDKAIIATERLGTALERNVRLASEAAANIAAANRGGTPGARGPGANGAGAGAGGTGTAAPARATGFGDHDLMLTGLAASMLGGAVTSFYATAVKSGMDAGHVKAIMGADDRVTKAQIDHASDQAYSVTKSVPGSTVSGNLGLILDLKQVTGNMDEAITSLPQFAKLVTTLEAIDRRSGGGGDAGFAAAKAMEILGRMTVEDPAHPGQHIIDPAELARNVAMLTQVAVGTNGRVDPAAYLAFAKQARVGGMALNDKALFRDLPALLMVQGGSRAGTGEAATYQQFINGQMTKNTMEMLKKFGLLDASSTWVGGRVQNMSKHLKGSQEFSDNPVDWVRDVLIPKLNKMGITDPVKQAQAVSSFAGKQTTAGFLGEITRAIAAINKESENLAHTRSDSFEMLQANDPSQALRNFDAAWHNLLTTLGETASGDAVGVLKALTAGINDISDWARRHPDTAEKLLATAGGLGAIATAVGALSTAIFLFGPALKLLGIGDAGAAAKGGATATEGAAAGAAAAATGILPWLLKRSGLVTFLWPNTSIQSEADELTALRKALGLPNVPGPVAPGVVAPDASAPPSPRGPAMPADRHASDTPSNAMPGATPANPVHVIVTNPGAIGDAAARGTTDRIQRGLSRPAPFGTDGRVSPDYLAVQQ